jgi:hypothetical protein
MSRPYPANRVSLGRESETRFDLRLQCSLQAATDRLKRPRGPSAWTAPLEIRLDRPAGPAPWTTLWTAIETGHSPCPL